MRLIEFKDSVFASDKIERVSASADDDGTMFFGITTVSGDVMSWEYKSKDDRDEDFRTFVMLWRECVQGG